MACFDQSSAGAILGKGIAAVGRFQFRFSDSLHLHTRHFQNPLQIVIAKKLNLD